MESEKIDLIFKALAHVERRRILTSLSAKPNQSLFEICASSVSDSNEPLTRQTISQHLEALERAGLIVTLWNGRTKGHSINLEPLRAATEFAISRYF
jgi:DNA-binding transcriptional ArsR family regulator